MITIIPAIDIIDGHCVRLTRGDYSQRKIYDCSPLEMAQAFEDCGVERLHLVDLDGAKASSPRNLKTLEQIADKVSLELEWGGGIATEADLRSVFSCGANQAIIGSVAALYPDDFSKWLRTFGPDKMILGADIKDGLVAVKGWLKTSSLSLEELIDLFIPQGLSQAIVTDISKDGMLQGPSTELYKRLQNRYPGLCICVSGGISSMEDILSLDKAGLPRVIVGKALYEGRITLKDLKQWSQNA